MFYGFPRIENISDVLPAIEGFKEFIVAKKDHFTVVNYVMQQNSTFSRERPGWEIRRECRGIKFDNTSGKILQRPFHKFFNLGEHPEVALEEIDFSQPYLVQVKMDGSMIIPIIVDGHVRWTTKMGITSVALEVEKYISKDRNVFAKMMLEGGYTPIFEFTGPTNRIVIDYKETKLTLLAVRDTVTGEYFDISEMPDSVDFDAPAEDFEQLVEKVRGCVGEEGVVVAFMNGHKTKIKGDHYVALHRAKDAVQREHDLVSLIVNEQLDDARAIMDDDTKRKVDEYTSRFLSHLFRTVDLLESQYALAKMHYGDDRKAFATACLPQFSWSRAYLFKMWDGHDAYQIVLNHIKKASQRASNWEEFKSNTVVPWPKWEGVLWQQ